MRERGWLRGIYRTQQCYTNQRWHLLGFEVSPESIVMKPDIKIGQIFLFGFGFWECTDVGTRVIVAIKYIHNDPSWGYGPPYALQEHVFDEDDYAAIEIYKNIIESIF